jgi:hypothetical protein
MEFAKKPCLTVGGEKVGRCGVIHGGIPKGSGTYPIGGAAHGIGDDQ